MTTIRVKRLHPNGTVPQFKSAGAAAVDLCAAEPAWVECGAPAVVNTGIAIEIPQGHYGQIQARSGLAANEGIFVMGGVIDSDYRGPVKVILSKAFGHLRISQGDRIAQLVIHKLPEVCYVQSDSLSETDRGASAFGSTGA